MIAIRNMDAGNGRNLAIYNKNMFSVAENVCSYACVPHRFRFSVAGLPHSDPFYHTYFKLYKYMGFPALHC